jgi:hypothetical protein
MPRKEERLSYLKEIELEFASGKRSARISDISSGGCYIDTISQVPVGEPLTLYISNGDGEAQEFNGRVAYLLEGFGFGVEFIDLRDEHREFLSRLLNSSAG